MLSSSGESIENNQHAANMQYFEVFISYDINNPSELNSWDGEAYPIFIFGHREFLGINSKNIFTSLLWIANFIKARKVEKGKILDVTDLQRFSKVAWDFFLSIYEAEWDSIPIDNHNTSFRNAVIDKSNPKLVTTQKP